MISTYHTKMEKIPKIICEEQANLVRSNEDQEPVYPVPISIA
jgi:hypothetical protein